MESRPAHGDVDEVEEDSQHFKDHEDSLVLDPKAKAQGHEDDVVRGGQEHAAVDGALEIDVLHTEALLVLLALNLDVVHIFAYVLHNDR